MLRTLLGYSNDINIRWVFFLSLSHLVLKTSLKEAVIVSILWKQNRKVK